MTTTEELGFEKNNGQFGITKDGKDWPSDFVIENGNTVILKCDGNRVTVDDVQQQFGNTYEGNIRGFECGGVKLKNLKVGERMTFSDDYVHHCAK